MDTPWVLQQLREFIAMTGLRHVPDPPGMVIMADTRRTIADRNTIVAAAQVIEQILNVVLPRWRLDLPSDDSKRWQQHREAAVRAIAQLERQQEIAEKLGDNAPRLSASKMHPWIWEGAKSLWQSGHYREAVRAASVKLNAETQNKIGRRDISESDLFNQAFSDDEPKPGNPRLRMSDDDGGKTALSIRRGVRSFAQGCYAAIRNPLSHDSGELSEDEALEQLAAFSILARWADSSTIVTS